MFFFAYFDGQNKCKIRVSVLSSIHTKKLIYPVFIKSRLCQVDKKSSLPSGNRVNIKISILALKNTFFGSK